MKKGCLFLLVFFLLASGAEYWALEKIGWQEYWWVSLLLGLSLVIVISNIWGIWLAFRQWRSSMVHSSEWTDGKLIGVSGRIVPLKEPLISPFSGTSVVLYEYDVKRTVRHTKGSSYSRVNDFNGFGMAPCRIQSANGSIRLVGFPLMVNFPENTCTQPAHFERAPQYLSSATWTPQSKSPMQAIKQLGEVLSDADGDLRIDFKTPTAPFDPDSEQDKLAAWTTYLQEHSAQMTEHVVPSGAEVAAFGTYRKNPPQLDVGSGLKNLSHGLFPGSLAKVVGRNFRKSLIAVLLWGAAAIGAHWYIFFKNVEPSQIWSEIVSMYERNFGQKEPQSN